MIVMFNFLNFVVSADMDVPHQEKEVGSAYSFVTSTTEPTVGYFLPREERQYIYRVKCEDAQTCSFEKIDTGYEIPSGLGILSRLETGKNQNKF